MDIMNPGKVLGQAAKGGRLSKKSEMEGSFNASSTGHF